MAEIKEVPIKTISTQPKSIAPMTAGGNKNALNRRVGPDGMRGWSYSLFGCFSACGFCCFATFCPCFVYSRNKQHLRSLQHRGVPLPAGTGTTDEHCCLYCVLQCLTCDGWILQIRNREEIRERYGIRGSAIGDCFLSCCCGPCSLTQERREIELEEKSFPSG